MGILRFIRDRQIANELGARKQDLYSKPIEEERHADIPALAHFKIDFKNKLLAECAGRKPITWFINAFVQAAEAFYLQEIKNNPITPSQNILIGDGTHRDQVLRSLNKRQNFAKNFPIFEGCLLESWRAFLTMLPPNAFASYPIGMGAVSLFDLIPDFGKNIGKVYGPLWSQENNEIGLFAELDHTMNRNVNAASGATYPQVAAQKVWSYQHPGTPKQIADLYLAETPLAPLFNVHLSYEFAHRLDQHAVLVAPSGWGKTQTFEAVFASLALRPSPPCIIVINSQGKLLDHLQRMDIFKLGGPEGDRRIAIIDPEHPDAPALNMFDLKKERVGSYDRNVREQIEAGVIETFQYLFSAVANDLTGKQETAFNYLMQLVLSIPGATFNTFFELLQEQTKDPKGLDSKFYPHIEKLDLHAQGFFQTQYFTKAFTDTRQQIGQRIYRVINRPAFQRMFGAKENKLDLFDLMDKRYVILVNTSKNLLGEEGSAFFGRWIVAMIMRAAYERVAVQNPAPCVVMIDEASDYVDKSFEKALSKLRQFNVGFLMAFQNCRQIPILDAVLANTSIKLVGGNVAADAKTMASDMRTTPEFLMSTRQYHDPKGSDFGLFVRGETPSAIRFGVSYFAVQGHPRLTDEEHKILLEKNRERYAAIRSTKKWTLEIYGETAQYGQEMSFDEPVGTVKFKVPPGTKNGDRVTYHDAMPDCDLTVRFCITEHLPHTPAPGSPNRWMFSRVTVTPKEASEGVFLDTLSSVRGDPISFVVPPGTVAGDRIQVPDWIRGWDAVMTVDLAPDPEQEGRPRSALPLSMTSWKIADFPPFKITPKEAICGVQIRQQEEDGVYKISLPPGMTEGQRFFVHGTAENQCVRGTVTIVDPSAAKPQEPPPAAAYEAPKTTDGFVNVNPEMARSGCVAQSDVIRGKTVMAEVPPGSKQGDVVTATHPDGKQVRLMVRVVEMPDPGPKLNTRPEEMEKWRLDKEQPKNPATKNKPRRKPTSPDDPSHTAPD